MNVPQKENGFTPIANEILEQLVKLRIPASEKDILFFILRKTYGYHKKEDRISLTQFELWTGLSRPTVVKALKNLIIRNILIKSCLLFKFNKYYDSWVVNTPLLVKYENTTSKLTLTKTSKHTLTHKRKKKTKETSALDFSKDGLINKTMKYQENTIDYETNQNLVEQSKSNKREDAIKLAKLFDKMATEYFNKPICTSKSYFIVLNAMNKHKLKEKGILKLYNDWFNDSSVKEEDKGLLSWCLGNANITRFKIKN